MKNLTAVFSVLIFLTITCCSKNEAIEEVISEPNYLAGYFDRSLSFQRYQGLPPISESWELIDVITDEFDGNTINATKWNDLHPAWSGRRPSQFKRANTTVRNGYLQLKSTSRIDNMSQVNNPNEDIWVDAASMTSKAASAKVGYYYETSFKASALSMTSSFWFRIGKYSEIDVIEHIGYSSIPEDEPDHSYEYAANTHYYGVHNGLDPLPAKYKMSERGRDDFNTYGLWWKDKKTLLFYLNGLQVMQITPRVDFDENLFLIFDTEVFTWAGLPTISSLKDDTKNTMYVDFVRSYKPTSTPTFDSRRIKNGSFEVNGIENWSWKGDVSLNTLTTNLNDGIINVNLKNGGSIIQKVEVNQNQNYTLSWNSKVESGNVRVEIIDIHEKTKSTSSWSSNSLNFNSKEKTNIYLKITASENSNAFLDAFKLQ